MMRSKSKPFKNYRQARPFLKWAGGKSQLLEQFEYYYPQELKDRKIERYIEPFIGGGAVFFKVFQEYQIKDAYLYDKNEDLILIYKVLQKDMSDLCECLEKFSLKYHKLDNENREKFFYNSREKLNNSLQKLNFKKYSNDWVVRAAQLIFLNKTCYNGLFRLNKKGEFNTPFGKYSNPLIFDKENLVNVSELLQRAEIILGDFQDCRLKVNDKSFVYFDPPYRPLSKTASFSSYSKYEFNDENQLQLAKFYKELNNTTNANLMLSNSDPMNVNPEDDFFEKLYKDLHIHKVSANRMINSKADKRGQIKELLILNYSVSKMQTIKQMNILDILNHKAEKRELQKTGAFV